MAFKDYLPSTVFRKKVLSIVIIISIILVIFLGVNLIKKGLHNYKINRQIKKLPIELQAEARTITLGELQRKDSNSNGIPDWEERLFGLDPLTNGESNKSTILKKKADIQAQNPDAVKMNQENANTDTARFAQSFISMVMSLEGSNALTPDALNNISAKAGEGLSDYELPDFLSSWDVKTVDNSVISRDKYINAVLKEFASISNTNGSYELSIISEALDTQTDAGILLSPLVITYKSSANSLRNVFVPKELINQHLAIVNSLDHIATSLENMKYVSTDPARATKGITQYQVYSESLNNAIKEIQAKY
jgi:hypothetical protein